MKERKQNIQVVLVEDNPYYNRLITKYVRTICSGSFFSDFQFTIKSYLSAHECIENMEDDWNILILDYFLFNRDEDDILNGADVLKETQKYCPDCNVIILSSLKSESKILKLQEEGIYAYVDKNVSSLNRVGSLLQSILQDFKEKRA